MLGIQATRSNGQLDIPKCEIYLKEETDTVLVKMSTMYHQHRKEKPFSSLGHVEINVCIEQWEVTSQMEGSSAHKGKPEML